MQFFRLVILSNRYLVQIMRYCLVPRKYKERQKMLRKLFSYVWLSNEKSQRKSNINTNIETSYF